MPCNIAICGLGQISGSHAAAIAELPDFDITHVCDLDADRREQAARRYGAMACASVADVLTARPDVVVIALPHHLHADTAVAALDAGCHVVVEKPLAVSVAGCRRMLAAAERNDRVLHVSDSGAYTPGAARTGDRFRRGDLGRFLTGVFCNAREYFTPARPDWFLDPQTSGGGMFANVGVHRLAITRRCLTGQTPVAVSASVSRVPAYPVEGCTSALVRYADGGAMHYEELGYFRPPAHWPGDHHYVFEEGIVTFDADSWRLADRHGRVAEERLHTDRAQAYGGVYRDLLRALHGDDLRGPDVYAYATDTVLARAVYTSAERGREVDLRAAEWALDQPAAHAEAHPAAVG